MSIQYTKGQFILQYLSTQLSFLSRQILGSSFLLFALLYYHRVSGECGFAGIQWGAFTYSNTSCGGLTDFPDGVPWNIIVVDLSYNNIETLETPAGYPNLVTFKANVNLMRDFPTLTSFKDTLQNLELRSNEMSYINPDLLAPLVMLYSLNLGNNLLTTIPDVVGPIPQVIVLYGNAFEAIPPLPNLGRLLAGLNLRYNQIANVSGNISFPKLKEIWIKGIW